MKLLSRTSTSAITTIAASDAADNVAGDPEAGGTVDLGGVDQFARQRLQAARRSTRQLTFIAAQGRFGSGAADIRVLSERVKATNSGHLCCATNRMREEEQCIPVTYRGLRS